MKRLILLIILLHCFSSGSWLSAVEVKPLKTIVLSQADNIIIERAASFIVTEDQRILVTDSKAANIKIFDLNGKRMSVFGGKGIGPNEFLRPWLSTYREPVVAFMDFGRKLTFLFKRIAGDQFEFLDKFLCVDLGNDFQFVDDNAIMIAGDKYDDNKNWNSLYLYDLKEKKYDFILPSMTAYGYSSQKAYLKANDGIISYIGTHRFLDVSNDCIYFVWTANLKVFQIDRKTKSIKKFFGQKTENYAKPDVTPEIVNAFNQKDHRLIYQLRRKMSYIRDIFVSNKNTVGLVYVGPFTGDDRLKVMLQLYSDNGTFLNEILLLYAKAGHHYEIYFYFRKSDNSFFVLDTETTEGYDQFYRVHQYKIEE